MSFVIIPNDETYYEQIADQEAVVATLVPPDDIRVTCYLMMQVKYSLAANQF